MAKIDKDTADKELEKLLLKWTDGMALPEYLTKTEMKKATPAEAVFTQSFDIISDYMQLGLMHIQDDIIVMQNGENDPLEFTVPKGEALMNMGDLDMAGYMKFAASMSKQTASFFPNASAKVAKRGMALAILFMQLP